MFVQYRWNLFWILLAILLTSGAGDPSLLIGTKPICSWLNTLPQNGLHITNLLLLNRNLIILIGPAAKHDSFVIVNHIYFRLKVYCFLFRPYDQQLYNLLCNLYIIKIVNLFRRRCLGIICPESWLLFRWVAWVLAWGYSLWTCLSLADDRYRWCWLMYTSNTRRNDSINHRTSTGFDRTKKGYDSFRKYSILLICRACK